MQNTFRLLLFVIFISGCSNNKFDSDKELLNHTLINSPSDPEYLIKDIVTFSPPTKFKGLTIDFEFYQANYFNIEDISINYIKYYVVNNGEIYRLGKGYDCIILSKEFRWNENGKLISNYSDWYNKNNPEVKLYSKNPRTINKTFGKQKNYILPEKFSNLICK